MTTTRYPFIMHPLAPLLEDLLGGGSAAGRTDGALLRAPESEVVEAEDEVRVVMDLPGVEPGDLAVSLEQNVLTVSGQRRPPWSEAEERSHVWHLAERRYGGFSRSFVLPRDVDPERIRADLDDGVLTVTIPKSERARRRRIEVRGA